MKTGNVDQCEDKMELNTTQSLDQLTIINETKYVNLIADVDELKWFYDNVLPNLKQAEVYFLSLSGRNKYLTDEEKQYYQLGRNEMFENQLCVNMIGINFYTKYENLSVMKKAIQLKIICQYLQNVWFVTLT